MLGNDLAVTSYFHFVFVSGHQDCANHNITCLKATVSSRQRATGFHRFISMPLAMADS
jgi:hypothetical protein